MILLAFVGIIVPLLDCVAVVVPELEPELLEPPDVLPELPAPELLELLELLPAPELPAPELLELPAPELLLLLPAPELLLALASFATATVATEGEPKAAWPATLSIATLNCLPFALPLTGTEITFPEVSPSFQLTVPLVAV
jgi:hypothetical protein